MSVNVTTGATLVRGDAHVAMVPGVFTRYATSTVPRAAVVRTVAVGALGGAAVIHYAAAAANLYVWAAAAAFFIYLGAAQALAAVSLVLFRSRPLELSVIAMNLVALTLWSLSRSVGLPLGPHAFVPEAIGTPDLVAACLEVVASLSLGLLLLPLRSLRAPLSRAAFRSAVATLVLAITGLTAGGSIAMIMHGHREQPHRIEHSHVKEDHGDPETTVSGDD